MHIKKSQKYTGVVFVIGATGSRQKKSVGGVTTLERSGYRKRKMCELCGFKAQDKIQLDVYFVDGNLRNVKESNLKTVCANCQRLGGVRKLGWRVGDLVADD